MKRKYLDDKGVTNRPDLWKDGKVRREQRRIYGFDARETYDLVWTWELWLYERLKMFVEVSGEWIDLSEGDFEWKGEKRSLGEMIEIMIEKIERVFDGVGDGEDEQEIFDMWAIVGKSLWW